MLANKKFDVITIGGATEDITLFTKEGILINNKKDILRQKLLAFEYGAKIKIDKSRAFFGGGASNSAVAISKLGLRSAALIAVGQDDRAERIIKNLKAEGVDISFVQRNKNIETGFSFLLVGQSNEHVVFSNRAANSNLNLTAKDLLKLKKSEWLYITSLSGKWDNALKKVFSLKEVKIAWNPGHIQLNSGYEKIGRYLKKTDVLIINKDEAIELVFSNRKYKNKGRDFLNDTENLLKAIKLWTPGIIVITNGKYGAYANDGQKIYYQPIIKERKRVDTTGVGDAFGSSFIVGLKIYKGDIIKAMRLAARNTASAIAEPGAQNGLLTKKDI
jgi:ribokinase